MTAQSPLNLITLVCVRGYLFGIYYVQIIYSNFVWDYNGQIIYSNH
jgi:hypothetical protein